MKRIIQMLIVGLLGFSMVGCHGCKDPVVDPCEGVEEVVADFTMEKKLGGFFHEFRWFEADTFVPGYVRFNSICEYDSIKRTVGLDPKVFTQNQFSLYFEDPISIDIVMVGYKKPNKNCYPSDDGIDTIKKHLVVVPYSESKLIGKYDGYFLSEPDSSFQLVIEYQAPYSLFFKEFYKGYPRSPGEFEMASAYKNFCSDRSGVFGQQGIMPGGWGELTNDTLKFDFHYYLPNSGGEVKDTFIGVKL